MRVFALSDVHVDFEPNARWVSGLSLGDYRQDLLMLCGDVSDLLPRIEWCLSELSRRFAVVLFVPGNHEFWVARDPQYATSLQKFDAIRAVTRNGGASMESFHAGNLSIHPLLGWYDYSFGEPTPELFDIWVDSYACRWPVDFDVRAVTRHFCAMNPTRRRDDGATTITFSHFMPRIDLLPTTVPAKFRVLDPVLGSTLIEQQLRDLGSAIHVYGHSHVRRRVTLDGVTYVNNALGYPHEKGCIDKGLVCVHEH
jgi:predicted phosphodiesterase